MCAACSDPSFCSMEAALFLFFHFRKSLDFAFHACSSHSSRTLGGQLGLVPTRHEF